MLVGPPVAVRLAVVGPGPLEHDPADVRSRAKDLLARPPYADDAGVVERLLNLIGERIAGFLQAVLSALSGDALVAWIIVGVGVVVLSALVWRATRGTTVDRSIAEVAPGATTRSAAQWHDLADRHVAAGELFDAVRCRYAAVVAALTEAATIEDVPGRTVRELGAEVAVNAPLVADDVAAAGRRIEAIVYGRQPPTQADLDIVTAAARAVERSRSKASAVRA